MKNQIINLPVGSSLHFLLGGRDAEVRKITADTFAVILLDKETSSKIVLTIDTVTPSWLKCYTYQFGIRIDVKIPMSGLMAV